MPSPTLWNVVGSWASYAALVALLSVLGPAILDRKGGRAFVLCVALVCLAAAFVKHPVPFSASFWVSHPGEASAGLAATAVGYGLPILGAALWISFFRNLDRSRAKLWLQVVGGLAVAALLSPLSESVAMIVALFLIEGVLGIH
jgi:hypothetical protein